MKENSNPLPRDKSSSRQIVAIVRKAGDWRGETLSNLRDGQSR